jgi:myo-inositol-1(or 4)-monophosphatase
MIDNQIISVATTIVKEAGDIALSYFRKDVHVDIKKDHSLVSLVDREAETAMRSVIRSHFPDHDIFGEEFGGSLKSKKPLWILDPIEGTTNFLHGIPVFGSQCALMENSKLIVAAMYDPVSHILIHASLGQGTFQHQKKITLLSQPLAEVTLLFDTGRNQEIFNTFLKSSVISRFRSVRRLGSLVTDVSFLTTSKYSCYLGFNGKLYDFAPAALILAEAGYSVFDHKLKDWVPQQISSIFACDPALRLKLTDLLKPILVTGNA